MSLWISPNTEIDHFELDELYWFVGFKPNTETRENIYITLMVSRNPRQIVGFAVDYEKTAKVFQGIVDSALPAKNYCTDGNLTYLDVMFPGPHIRNVHDKSDTHNVESINADLRTYIAGLFRRNRCFYRSIETLRAVFAIFVNAYNKFGAAKYKHRIPVVHRPGNEGNHLHQTRDYPLGLISFIE